MVERVPTKTLHEAAREGARRAVRERLLAALRNHFGNVSHASRELGMGAPAEVYRALRRHGYGTRAQRDRLLSEMRGGAQKLARCPCRSAAA